jgi:hypothetical protein
MTGVLGRTAHSETDFIALVCADEEFLRAEFEEIIAAGWGPPPLPAGGRGGDRGPDPAGHRPGIGDARPHPTRLGAGCDEQTRQRSPPPGSRPRERAPAEPTTA